ncbi:MAG: hypothetical protein ACI4QE_00860 [Acutalibacteraceae bacterium]
MDINFNGFKEEAVTFACDEGLATGSTLVKVTDSGTVAPCTSDEVFAGVCKSVRDGYATVILSGYVEMPVSSEIPVGYRNLVSDNGKVKVSETGREYLVINSESDKIGFIL